MYEVTQNYNLEVINPGLSKEWHPDKNETLTPNVVTPMSGKKVWWICRKGHEWEATISHRSQGSGCPFCSGNRVCDDNCLQTINPQLSEQWHRTKNDTLTPKDVFPMSKRKVWWICSKGHEWKASVATRNKGTGCPYCTGQAVCNDNSLQTINPILSRQWDPWKNGILTPGDVTANSGRKVWWVCNNDHEWQAVVANRNRGRGCPYCARRNNKQ